MSLCNAYLELTRLLFYTYGKLPFIIIIMPDHWILLLETSSALWTSNYAEVYHALRLRARAGFNSTWNMILLSTNYVVRGGQL